MRVLVVGTLLVALAASADAETVALLPLDGEKRLEMYGQPVAAEIGRAIKDAGIEVVVVGAKMDVPDRAQLIVDGTIKAGKGDAIALSIRIRDPRDGTVLQTLPANAATLTTIDKAAAELTARVVPAVKEHLAAITKPPVQPDKPIDPVKPPPTPPVEPPRSGPRLPALHVSVMAPASPVLSLLAASLREELPGWAGHHGHEPTLVDKVDPKGEQFAIALEVRTFAVDPGKIPLARARVHVRVVDDGKLILNRVVRTDTIVGDKDITEHELGARTAREVLSIVHAQLRRKQPGWR